MVGREFSALHFACANCHFEGLPSSISLPLADFLGFCDFACD